MILKKLLTLPLLFLLGACAIGNQYNLDASSADLRVETGNSVAVAVIDSRRYVRNKTKAPNFVGLQRGGFGNPFDVTTKSGKSLASDVGTVIVRSLSNKKIQASAVDLKPDTSTDGAIDALKKTGAARGLLVVLNEWKSDATMRLRLLFDLQASVFDQSGKLRGSSAASGDEVIGTAEFESGNAAMVSRSLGRRLGTVLNDPKIIDALQ